MTVLKTQTVTKDLVLLWITAHVHSQTLSEAQRRLSRAKRHCSAIEQDIDALASLVEMAWVTLERIAGIPNHSPIPLPWPTAAEIYDLPVHRGNAVSLQTRLIRLLGEYEHATTTLWNLDRIICESPDREAHLSAMQAGLQLGLLRLQVARTTFELRLELGVSVKDALQGKRSDAEQATPSDILVAEVRHMRYKLVDNTGKAFETDSLPEAEAWFERLWGLRSDVCPRCGLSLVPQGELDGSGHRHGICLNWNCDFEPRAETDEPQTDEEWFMAEEQAVSEFRQKAIEKGLSGKMVSQGVEQIRRWAKAMRAKNR